MSAPAKPTAGRPPPCDLDAEAAVLSTCLLKQEWLDTVATLVRPEDFFSDSNAWIFDAILAISSVGEKVDTTTVAGYLKAKDRLTACGGLAYLVQVTDATPAVHHVEAHAQIVRRLAKLRRCIAEAQAIAAEGYGAAADVQEFLDGACARITKVAEPDRVGSMVTMRDAVGEAYAALGKGKVAGGIASGWTGLDKLTAGWHRGELTVLAGRPGMGKTAAMMQTAIEVADHRGMRNGQEFTDQFVAVFSIEMLRGQLVTRAIASEARVDSNRVRQNALLDTDWPKLSAAADYLSALPMSVDDTSKPSPVAIRAHCRRLQREQAQYGRSLGLVCVDYAQLVDGKPLVGKNDNREREVAEVSAAMKRIAKDLNVPVILLAQLSRPPKGVQVPKPPQLSDLRESGSLEQDADAVIFIHREEYYLLDSCPEDKKGVASFIVAKQRNGPTGTVQMAFDGAHVRFSDAPQPRYS